MLSPDSEWHPQRRALYLSAVATFLRESRAMARDIHDMYNAATDTDTGTDSTGSTHSSDTPSIIVIDDDITPLEFWRAMAVMYARRSHELRLVLGCVLSNAEIPDDLRKIYVDDMTPAQDFVETTAALQDNDFAAHLQLFLEQAVDDDSDGNTTGTGKSYATTTASPHASDSVVSSRGRGRRTSRSSSASTSSETSASRGRGRGRRTTRSVSSSSESSASRGRGRGRRTTRSVSSSSESSASSATSESTASRGRGRGRGRRTTRSVSSASSSASSTTSKSSSVSRARARGRRRTSSSSASSLLRKQRRCCSAGHTPPRRRSRDTDTDVSPCTDTDTDSTDSCHTGTTSSGTSSRSIPVVTSEALCTELALVRDALIHNVGPATGAGLDLAALAAQSTTDVDIDALNTMETDDWFEAVEAFERQFYTCGPAAPHAPDSWLYALIRDNLTRARAADAVAAETSAKPQPGRGRATAPAR
jgi:hypothetical protein